MSRTVSSLRSTIRFTFLLVAGFCLTAPALAGNPAKDEPVQRGTEGAGVRAKDVNRLLISRLSIEHSGGDGVHWYEDPRVCDNLITDNDGTNLDMFGCHIVAVQAK